MFGLRKRTSPAAIPTPPCARAAPPRTPGTALPTTAADLITQYNAGERNFKGLTLPSGTSLKDVNLRDLWAPGAVLSGVDLSGADLTGANLEGADLRGVKGPGAHLVNACLRTADLRRAEFHGPEKPPAKPADFTGADLQSARLSGADLRAVILRGAFLYGVIARRRLLKLQRADLRGANLSTAKLPRAQLAGAILDGASLSGTDLTGADVGSGVGARFDLTRTRQMAFSTTTRGFLTASPLWLQLRSAYTGVWMVVHLVLVGVFIVPHIVEAAILRAASSGRLAVLRVAGDTAAADTSLQAGMQRRGDTLVLGGVTRIAADSLERIARRVGAAGVRRYVCLRGPCETLPLWKVLLGWDDDWWVRIGLALAYVSNLLRLILTLIVSMLRDHETLTGLSPAATTCTRLGAAHWVFRILILYVLGSGLVHVARLLQQPVLLPA
jgi:uncharacterized protein YjbI with pentapeptide repeats